MRLTATCGSIPPRSGLRTALVRSYRLEGFRSLTSMGPWTRGSAEPRQVPMRWRTPPRSKPGNGEFSRREGEARREKRG